MSTWFLWFLCRHIAFSLNKQRKWKSGKTNKKNWDKNSSPIFVIEMICDEQRKFLFWKIERSTWKRQFLLSPKYMTIGSRQNPYVDVADFQLSSSYYFVSRRIAFSGLCLPVSLSSPYSSSTDDVWQALRIQLWLRTHLVVTAKQIFVHDKDGNWALLFCRQVQWNASDTKG